MNEEVLLSDIKVTRPCRRCYGGRPLTEIQIYLVSPTGVVHHAGDYGETGCGIDATGADWWWRL